MQNCPIYVQGFTVQHIIIKVFVFNLPLLVLQNCKQSPLNIYVILLGTVLHHVQKTE